MTRHDAMMHLEGVVAGDAWRPNFAPTAWYHQNHDSWVWTHPRVSLTPHTSNGGTGMRPRSEANFLDNLARMVQGQPLRNVVRHNDIV